MKTKKLILLEGLPGTGKTTIIKWLAENLLEKGKQVTLLFEGDSQIPCDFYETAGVPKAVFDDICAKNPEVADILFKQGLFAVGYVFLRIDELPEFLQNILRCWDMGDEMNQKVTVEEYIPCALARLDYWVQSMKNECGVTLIDSGFLQNPINELLFRGATDTQVQTFIKEIAIRFQPLHPFCVYLYRSNAKDSIRFAEKVKGQEWAHRVQNLLCQLGYENHFDHRFELEMRLISTDLIPGICCQIIDDDWTYVKELITKELIDVPGEINV